VLTLFKRTDPAYIEPIIACGKSCQLYISLKRSWDLDFNVNSSQF
jgi:hypothetical protein